MKKLKKPLLWIAGILLFLYLCICSAYYFLQEKFLFTHRQPASYRYQFQGKYEERNIITRDGKKLNGLLFKAEAPKGLIFYLHGSGHALDKWGTYAKTYTDLHYDIFFLDYRGYGKSEGQAPTEQQLYNDVQDTYNDLKTSYAENHIAVLGYSLGTGPAAYIAAHNHPRLLLLQAPYYSGAAAVKNNFPFFYAIIPNFLLKYPLNTYQFVQQTQSPVVIIHGTNDSTFNIQQAYALKKLLKPNDQLIVLPHQGHNHFTENPDYIKALQKIFR